MIDQPTGVAAPLYSTGTSSCQRFILPLHARPSATLDHAFPITRVLRSDTATSQRQPQHQYRDTRTESSAHQDADSHFVWRVNQPRIISAQMHVPPIELPMTGCQIFASTPQDLLGDKSGHHGLFHPKKPKLTPRNAHTRWTVVDGMCSSVSPSPENHAATSEKGELPTPDGVWSPPIT